MGSEWVPLEGLAQTTRQMGGETDGQRHPRTSRRRETDRWTRTGRDGQTEVLVERGVRKMEEPRERERDRDLETGPSRKGDQVTEKGEREMGGRVRDRKR